MTSLDDTIISYQNMMLLDNVTNYSKESIDYFNFNFKLLDYQRDIPLAWGLLLKMRKHRLLRLPSCPLEDNMEYSIYLSRLHHCLWRRWSMETFHLKNSKINPLELNWNKELDMTVLYGPDLANFNSEAFKIEQESLVDGIYDIPCNTTTAKNDIITEELIEVDSDVSEMDSSFEDSLSVESIFDSKTKSNLMRKDHSTKRKHLKFNNIVSRRDIDRHGHFFESHLLINDSCPQ
ncbi:uncharacterized protein NDAI_0F00550 [Naumovozyma dairenensis CBS 421]|uniref:Uncharacterized protein n=1 Tax=Naumovozyma dairenensis (strain ATCC 10597 / BCRC 20456 / CBS 421 / NBRC 0211 / NRRL Y-12639) TaxID=1071378 RepID=G0WC63_NAUDC|nr:hypothetical protein NDAI_0F00550 [Naumovozyma dairenensis CBS 421]CCD25374.1 hypothetical protein NDAI_0F00550 [Naumovozyma dairenensis CBS 421]